MNTSILTISQFSAYGIIKKEEEVLLVRNSQGPYMGLLDLPGGEIKGFEQTEKALKRGIKAQSGLKIIKYEMIGYYECIIPIDAKSELHHRGMIYDIKKWTGNLKSESVAQLFNPLDLKESQLTPFAWKAIQLLLKRSQKPLSKDSSSHTLAL